MTNEQMQYELNRHAELLKRAELEQWTFPPIPLDLKAFRLRMQQFQEQKEEWFLRERQRQAG